jgi:hypothetical protein
MVAFPSSYDTFQNPGAGDSLNTTNVVHTAQHCSANDAISALERKVGIDWATATGTLDYLCKSAIDPGHQHSGTGAGGVGVTLKPILITANYTATTAYDLYRISASATVTLPGAMGSGRTYYFKNLSTNTATISASGSNTMDGNPSAQSVNQFDHFAVCDAVSGQWDILDFNWSMGGPG